MLDEDVGFGDITTTALIPPDQGAEARLFTRQTGIIAGVTIASIVFTDFGCLVKEKKKDGATIKANDTILTAQGQASVFLTLERTLLNLLQRMSGIATATSQLLKIARKANSKIRIAATRKTAPLLRFFDKQAVMIGGGDPHRWRLDDAILIKDNHLAFYSSPTQAVKQARIASSFTSPVEVEVTNVQDALTVAAAKPDIILLDNMSPTDIEQVVKSLHQSHPSIALEASGNISPNNIASYAKTGVDVISVGWLTHSVSAIDLSINIIPTKK
jgi:nicotinate-nucleotide pyrophosphorylase (carboxylating)